MIRDIVLKFHNPFTPRWFDRSMFDYIPQGKVLNVGSGNTKLRPDIINLDIVKYPNVDIVADAHSLPFGDEYFDGVFCNAVLEHTIRPWIVAGEIQRVLKTGGTLCVQTPFLEGVHDEYDFFRFTLKGLRSLFPEITEIKSGVSASTTSILADLLRVYPILAFENTFLHWPVAFAMGWFAKPFQYMDFLIRKSPSMPKYARAFYLVGVKK